jgi:Putative GTPases (G3E family)
MNTSPKPNYPVPVTILTGFRGAGKQQILKALLACHIDADV